MTDKVKDPKCYFCGKNVDDDSYCHGCLEYVCEECSLNPDVWGAHDVREHEDQQRVRRNR